EATLVLLLIRRLYRVEKRGRRLSPDKLQILRERRSRPVFERLGRLLAQIADTTTPGSRLGKAIQYAQGQWQRMERYLGDGRVEIDNNGIERGMRGIAMGRRAWLFCGSEEGGRRAATIYTLIENCRRAGVEPFAYLTDVLERLPTTPLSKVADLTPRRWHATRRG
ncbi:MAG: IS66 family transposase, partial [bacterium]|nr:IS66 family transposase [bacterium]